MPNKYSWRIVRLDLLAEHDGKKNVVQAIHWRRQANNGSNQAELYGSQTVDFDPSAPFTPYEKLTQAQVVAWLERNMGEEKLAAQTLALNSQIGQKREQNVGLPWAAK